MKKLIFIFIFSLVCIQVECHPMPNSTVDLFVLEKDIKGEAKIPLIELANAVGEQQARDIYSRFLIKYFTEHIKAADKTGFWSTTIQEVKITNAQDIIVGKYEEVIVQFTLTPTNTNYLRNFTLYYDAVLHQVITHSIIVSINQDWQNGILNNENKTDIGIIKLDIPSGKIFPLHVQLEKGSSFKGFTKLFVLGTEHIKNGTDHLLFLIILLLPALLVVNGKYWGKFTSTKNGIFRVAKIVTAFTIGHSITLLLGALQWLKLPIQLVEVIIAISILISAVHVLIPIFPTKEMFIASFFGLIHGLAFASVLSNLHLEYSTLIISVFAFNMGIECMQLFIVLLIIPWLILLSKTKFYTIFRIIFGLISIVLSIAWVIERYSNEKNVIGSFTDTIPQNGFWYILILAIFSIIMYVLNLLGKNIVVNTNKKKYS